MEDLDFISTSASLPVETTLGGSLNLFKYIRTAPKMRKLSATKSECVLYTVKSKIQQWIIMVPFRLGCASPLLYSLLPILSWKCKYFGRTMAYTLVYCTELFTKYVFAKSLLMNWLKESKCFIHSLSTSGVVISFRSETRSYNCESLNLCPPASCLYQSLPV